MPSPRAALRSIRNSSASCRSRIGPSRSGSHAATAPRTPIVIREARRTDDRGWTNACSDRHPGQTSAASASRDPSTPASEPRIEGRSWVPALMLRVRPERRPDPRRMPAELWPWLALAGLGFFHGINPAMGWLFAVALGLHRTSGAAVLLALVPLALGPAPAIAGVVFAVLGLGLVLGHGVR